MPETAAQVQRRLEKKYGVYPSPFWMDVASQSIEIDGIVPPVGKEIVFKCAKSGVICGVGITCVNGLMKFSALYGNDIWETRKTGRITGLQFNEEVTICINNAQFDYYPTIKYPGSWTRVFIHELWSV